MQLHCEQTDASLIIQQFTFRLIIVDGGRFAFSCLLELLLEFLLLYEVSLAKLLWPPDKPDSFGEVIEKLLGLTDGLLLAPRLLDEWIALVAAPH